jgi:hypothetical protein
MRLKYLQRLVDVMVDDALMAIFSAAGSEKERPTATQRSPAPS